MYELLKNFDRPSSIDMDLYPGFKEYLTVVCIITNPECGSIHNEHQKYLMNLSARARDMVYGDTGGKLDIHQRRLIQFC